MPRGRPNNKEGRDGKSALPRQLVSDCIEQQFEHYWEQMGGQDEEDECDENNLTAQYYMRQHAMVGDWPREERKPPDGGGWWGIGM